MREECGTLPIFLSDVKARHDKMVGLVETMLMTADSLRLTAYGGSESEGTAESYIVHSHIVASYIVSWPQPSLSDSAFTDNGMNVVRIRRANDARSCREAQAEAVPAQVDDWSASGKCHPMAQLYGTTEEEIRMMEAS